MNHVDRINGHSVHELNQKAYDEMFHAVTNTVEKGSEVVKTLEKSVKARPYLAGAIGVAVSGVALGAGALLVWRAGRQRSLLEPSPTSASCASGRVTSA